VSDRGKQVGQLRSSFLVPCLSSQRKAQTRTGSNAAAFHGAPNQSHACRVFHRPRRQHVVEVIIRRARTHEDGHELPRYIGADTIFGRGLPIVDRLLERGRRCNSLAHAPDLAERSPVVLSLSPMDHDNSLSGPRYKNDYQVPVYGQGTTLEGPATFSRTSEERPECSSQDAGPNSHQTLSTSSSSRSTTSTTPPLGSSTTENTKPDSWPMQSLHRRSVR